VCAVPCACEIVVREAGILKLGVAYCNIFDEASEAKKGNQRYTTTDRPLLWSVMSMTLSSSVAHVRRGSC